MWVSIISNTIAEFSLYLQNDLEFSHQIWAFAKIFVETFWQSKLWNPYCACITSILLFFSRNFLTLSHVGKIKNLIFPGSLHGIKLNIVQIEADWLNKQLDYTTEKGFNQYPRWGRHVFFILPRSVAGPVLNFTRSWRLEYPERRLISFSSSFYQSYMLHDPYFTTLFARRHN